MNGLSLALRIVEFILLFGVLVFLHEFGHYIVSRLVHVEVEEFGFGFPPRMVKLFTFQGTDFTLNWIPFGAFVRPKGEGDMNLAGGLAAASPWARLGVFLGGPVMNLMTGIILFSFVFLQTGAPDQKIVQVIDVSASSPAQQVGLLANDTIKAINGVSINSMTQLTTIVHNNIGKEITITYQRGGQTKDVKVTPRVNPPQGQGALGIVMGNPVLKINAFQALPYGFQMMIDQGQQLILLPGRLIRGQIPADQARVVGPVGMFDIYQSARNNDEKSQTSPAQSRPPAVNTLFLMATISVALGLTNLLPIPALDGGRILFILPELILRRRIPQQYENMVHLIGFATLLILMVYITAQDIINPIVLP